MNTSNRRPAARATTAAARAAFPQLAIASGDVGARGGPADLELEQRPEEMAGLVRPGHVAGLVLDPDAAGVRQPEGRRERDAPREGRDAEAVAVDRGDRVVEPPDQGDVVVVAPARGTGGMPGVEEPPVGDERVGVVGDRDGLGGRVEVADQDVIDPVAGDRVRADERDRRAVGRSFTAAGTGEPGRRPVAGGGRPARRSADHHATPTPVRSLNSSIIASQAGSSDRSSRHQDCARRASNSASGIPCCSTQVK